MPSTPDPFDLNEYDEQDMHPNDPARTFCRAVVIVASIFVVFALPNLIVGALL